MADPNVNDPLSLLPEYGGGPFEAEARGYGMLTPQDIYGALMPPPRPYTPPPVEEPLDTRVPQDQFIDLPTYRQTMPNLSPVESYDEYLGVALPHQLDAMGMSPEDKQATIEDFKKNVPRPEEPGFFSSVVRGAEDIGNRFQIGLNTAGQLEMGLVKRFLPDWVYQGLYPNKAGGGLDVSETALKQNLAERSPEMVASSQKRFTSDTPGGGTNYFGGNAWSDWRAWSGAVAESAPLSLAAVPIGIAAVPLAAELGVPTWMVATAMGGSFEGAFSGEQSGPQARKAIMEEKQSVLDQSPMYRQMVDEEHMTPEQARLAVADKADSRAFLYAFLATLPLAGLGETAIGKLVKGEVKGFFKKLGLVGLGELGEETGQGAGQQFGENLAIQQTGDPTISLGKDVPESAISSGAIGFASGITHGAAVAPFTGEPAAAPAPNPLKTPGTGAGTTAGTTAGPGGPAGPGGGGGTAAGPATPPPTRAGLAVNQPQAQAQEQQQTTTAPPAVEPTPTAQQQEQAVYERVLTEGIGPILQDAGFKVDSQQLQKIVAEANNAESPVAAIDNAIDQLQGIKRANAPQMVEALQAVREQVQNEEDRQRQQTAQTTPAVQIVGSPGAFRIQRTGPNPALLGPTFATREEAQAAVPRFSAQAQTQAATTPATGTPLTFQTAQGSTYTINPDGTTTRTKALRAEHPGEVGLQPQSEFTGYISPADANRLAQVQRPGQAVLHVDPITQHVALVHTTGPDAGKVVRGSVVPYSTTPTVGALPLEGWRGKATGANRYGTVHFGNDITRVASQGRGTGAPIPTTAQGLLQGVEAGTASAEEAGLAAAAATITDEIIKDVENAQPTATQPTEAQPNPLQAGGEQPAAPDQAVNPLRAGTPGAAIPGNPLLAGTPGAAQVLPATPEVQPDLLQEGGSQAADQPAGQIPDRATEEVNPPGRGAALLAGRGTGAVQSGNANVAGQPGSNGPATPDAGAGGGVGPVNNLRSKVRATPGVDMTRMARLLGPQLYGNMSDVGSVTIKELFQNSFDALKGAIGLGHRTDGKISVDLDEKARTITLSDNGTGMTPKTINDAFLTLAGTMKETERASGGLGIAKMLFLFGNESLDLYTVRDGVASTLHTSGKQLMAAFADPSKAPDIQTKKTSAPSGTTVTVKIPETFHNEETNTDEPIEFPSRWDTRKQLSDSPLFENIAVDLNGEEMPIGKNFPKDEFSLLNVVNFPWGKVRVMVAASEYPGHENVNVLSNGLLQFRDRITDDPTDFWAASAPYKFYFNIEPSVKADAPNYPIALNRKGFSRAAEGDVKALMQYLTAMYANTTTEAQSKSFGVLSQFSADGQTENKIDLNVPAAKTGTTLKIDKNDKVEIKDGRMYVNNRAMPEMTKEQLKTMKADPTQFRVDQGLLHPDLPIVHDNVLRNDQPYLDEARAALGAEAVNGYLLGVANVFRNLRNAAKSFGGSKYENVHEVPVGVSVDTGYYGVNTAIPFRAMMLNPTMVRGGTIEGAPGTMVGTMIHELAHHAERNHDETGFIPELQRMMVTLAQSGDMRAAIMDLEQVMQQYPQVYNYFDTEAKSGNLKNRGIRLDGGAQSIGGPSLAARLAAASETGGYVGDSTNLRSAIGEGDQNRTAGTERAGASATDANTLKAEKKAAKVVANMLKAEVQRAKDRAAAFANRPHDSLVGLDSGKQRRAIAYLQDDGTYNYYDAVPEIPQGIPGTVFDKLTRDQVEARMRERGLTPVGPQNENEAPTTTPPKATEEFLPGYDREGNLKMVAYQNENGTWAVYQSDTPNVTMDPKAFESQVNTKSQVQALLNSRGLRTKPIPASARVDIGGGGGSNTGNQNPSSTLTSGGPAKDLTLKLPKIRKARITWQNRFHALKIIGKSLGKFYVQHPELGPLPDSLRTDWQSTVRNTNALHVIDQMTEDHVTPLAAQGVAMMDKFGITQEQMDEYVTDLHYAERAENLERRFDPDTLDRLTAEGTAKEFIDQVERDKIAAKDNIANLQRDQPALYAAVLQWAQDAKKFADATVALRVQYGLMSPESANRITGTYQFYVPIQESERTLVSRPATGQTSRGDEPFKRLIDQMVFTVAQGESNKIRQSVYTIGSQLSHRVVDNDGKPLITFNGPPAEAKVRVNPRNFTIEMGHDTVGPLTKHAVPVYFAGVRNHMAIENDEIFEAVRPWTGAERDAAVTAVIGVLGQVNYIASMGKTSANPTYAVVNVLRDMGSMLFLMDKQYNPLDRAQVLLNMADPRTLASGFRAVFGEAFFNKKPDPNGLYGMTERAGGLVTPQAIAGLDPTVSSFTGRFKPGVGKTLKKWGKRPGDTQAAKILTSLSQWLESWTRTAIYKMAYDKHYKQFTKEGKDPAVAKTMANLRAGVVAKNTTLNYEEHGTLPVSPLFIFASPKITGFTNIIDQLVAEKNPYAWIGVAAAVTAGIAAAGLGYDNSKKDKDGISRYSKISQNKRDNYLIWDADQPMGIPLPQEIATFYALGHMVMDRIKGDTEAAWGKIAQRFVRIALNAFLPANVPQEDIGKQGGSTATYLTRIITPSAVVPFTDVSRNENAFGSPIVPKRAENLKQGVPLHEMYSKNENAMAVNMAKKVYEMTGFDYSPPALDYIAAMLDPTAAKFWMDMFGVQVGGPREKQTGNPLVDIPNTTFGNRPEPTYPGQIQNPFVRRFSVAPGALADDDNYNEARDIAKQGGYFVMNKQSLRRGNERGPDAAQMAYLSKLFDKADSDINKLFAQYKLRPGEEDPKYNLRKQEIQQSVLKQYYKMMGVTKGP